MFIMRRLYSRGSTSGKYLKPSKLNPGVHHRKEALKTQPDDNDDFDFEQMESDFMSIDKTHRDHMEEIYAMKEKEKYLIVRDRYFKEKYPNFLTWHDKEQIKYLHKSDPEEWTVARLSEGFPALPEVIMKIVKGKWTKQNSNKIQNHDKSVLKNWEEFKAGQLESLPVDLKEHLRKFTSRTVNLEPFDFTKLDKNKTIVDNRNTKVQGEFSEIISSYEKLKNKSKEARDKDSNEKLLVRPKESLNLEGKNIITKDNISQKNIITLKELQTSIRKRAEKGIELSVEDKILVRPKICKTQDKSVIEVEVQSENISDIIENKHKTESQIGFVTKTARDVAHLVYPETIIIPKKHYRKGYTYKLNDCYYDSDGEFLYRVPGMD